jgi:sarcosine oxidase subunit alpha
MSPTLGRAVCLAQVDARLAGPGTAVTIRLHGGSLLDARVTEHLAHVDPEGERMRV